MIAKIKPAFYWLLPLLLCLSAFNAQAGELPDFTKLVQKYGPAVVNISTKQKIRRNHMELPPGMQQLPDDSRWNDLFRHFFGQQGEDNNGPSEYDATSLGSGFIIDSDGYILTNYHVVKGADEILVRLSDRRELIAKLVGFDKRSDIALLKVKAKHLPVVKIGNTKDIKVGEWAMAIGSPFGFDHSVSVGVVSAVGRSLPDESYVPFIQTDVAINPGNSGGPLFNLDGQVIGINSQIYSRTGGYMGVSFAIPIDVAMNVVHQLKTKGYVSRGWLGVLIQDVTYELAESFKMNRPIGALVAKVLKGGPAAKAGLKVGDVIVKYDGKTVDTSSDLPWLVGNTPVGSDAHLIVIRKGKRRELTVRIEELPKETQIASNPPQPQHISDNRLHITVADLSPEQRKELGLDDQRSGVAVEEVEAGPAYDAGIRPQDVLTQINGVSIANVAQFLRVVRALPAGRSVAVLVQRSDGPIFLALRMPRR